MNVDRLLYQVEMSFWNTIIPLMSESPALEAFIKRLHNFCSKERLAEVVAFIFLWSGAGIILGFVLGIITGLF